MTHRFRYWKTYPTGDVRPMERRKGSRVVATCLSIGLLFCVAAIVVLFVLVLNLHAQRDREVADRTKAIDQAMCSVLAEFHGHSDDLAHARAVLHCPVPAS